MSLELGLRALSALGRWDEIQQRADDALAEAEQAGFRTRSWRILGARALAREALGDEQGATDDRRAARALLLELEEARKRVPQGAMT